MTEAASLTAMDIIVLLLVGGCAILGLIRGFVTEVLSLLAWVAAVMALRLFYAPASAWAADLTGTSSGGAVLAFAVLFFGAFILFRVIAGQLGSRTRTSVVGPIDRVLGGGFGAVKGLIGASLLFLAVNLGCDLMWGKDQPRPAWMAASRTYPLLKLSSRLIVDFVEERRGTVSDGARADAGDDDSGRDSAARRSAHHGASSRGKPPRRRDDDEDAKGYTSQQRHSLDALLDAAGASGNN